MSSDTLSVREHHCTKTASTSVEFGNSESWSKRLKPETVASSAERVLQRRNTSSSSSSSPSPSSSQSPAARQRKASLRKKHSDSPFWRQTWFVWLVSLMALSSLGIALFLFLTLDLDNGAFSSADASSSQGVEVWSYLNSVLGRVIVFRDL